MIFGFARDYTTDFHENVQTSNIRRAKNLDEIDSRRRSKGVSDSVTAHVRFAQKLERKHELREQNDEKRRKQKERQSFVKERQFADRSRIHGHRESKIDEKLATRFCIERENISRIFDERRRSVQLKVEEEAVAKRARLERLDSIRLQRKRASQIARLLNDRRINSSKEYEISWKSQEKRYVEILKEQERKISRDARVKDEKRKASAYELFTKSISN